MNGVKRRGKAQRRARRVHQKREEKKFEERCHRIAAREHPPKAGVIDVCFNLSRVSHILLGRIAFPDQGGLANESHPQAGEPLK